MITTNRGITKTVAVLAMMASMISARAGTYTWTATSAGPWSTTTDWTPNSPAGGPGVGDSVIDNESVVLDLSASEEVANLSLGSQAAILSNASGLTLQVDGAYVSTNTAYIKSGSTANALTLQIGTASNAGSVAINSGNTYFGQTTAAALAGGTVYGTTSIANGHNLYVNLVNNGSFDFTGAINLNGSGSLILNQDTTGVGYANTYDIGGLSSTGASSVSAAGTGATNVVLTNASGTGNTFSGVISNGTGNLNFAMQGADNTSVQTLTGDNTYTGTTTVNSGVLMADNSISSLGTGAVTVSGGVLGGTGTIATSGVTTSGTKAVEIQKGGMLAPSYGNTLSTSTLTFSLASGTQLALDNGALFSFNLGEAGNLSDLVNLTSGTLDLNGQTLSNFTFNLGSNFGAGTYNLIDTTNAIAGSFTSSSGTLDGYNVTLEESANGDDLVLAVVSAPEAGTGSMSLIGVGLLAGVLSFINRRRLS